MIERRFNLLLRPGLETFYLRASNDTRGVAQMRTVAEYLEKAAAFEQLAGAAATDLIRATYRDLAKAYRDLAKDRTAHIQEFKDAPQPSQGSG